MYWNESKIIRGLGLDRHGIQARDETDKLSANHQVKNRTIQYTFVLVSSIFFVSMLKPVAMYTLVWILRGADATPVSIHSLIIHQNI